MRVSNIKKHYPSYQHAPLQTRIHQREAWSEVKSRNVVRREKDTVPNIPTRTHRPHPDDRKPTVDIREDS